MKAILSIVAGLIVGVLVAGLLLGGILAFIARATAAVGGRPEPRDPIEHTVGDGVGRPERQPVGGGLRHPERRGRSVPRRRARPAVGRPGGR